MSDFISRQNAVEAVYNALRTPLPDYKNDLFHDSMSLAVSIVKSIPSAESEQKWISVSKALPENDDWVIVSIYDNDGDTSWQYTTPGFYVPYGKCWIVDNEYCRNVIAWMPLPEPYKGKHE